MFAGESFGATTAEEAAEHESDDEDIVELPGDRDEIRNEVERKREVPHEPDEEHLLATRYTRVPEEAAAEHEAVRDEAGQCPRARAPPGYQECEDEAGIDQDGRAERHEDPRPQAHG